MIFFKLHLKANHNFFKPLNFAFGWLGLSLRKYMRTTVQVQLYIVWAPSKTVFFRSF